MKQFPTHIAEFLERRGFRVLKRKADKSHEDGRHWLVVQLQRDDSRIDSCWTLFVMKMTPSQRYSVKTVKIPLGGNRDGGDQSLLGKALKRVGENTETFG